MQYLLEHAQAIFKMPRSPDQKIISRRKVLQMNHDQLQMRDLSKEPYSSLVIHNHIYLLKRIA